MIAGFDMESNQKAADGTVYDNGYGICFIPKTQVTTASWSTNGNVDAGYKSSTMHNTQLPTIVSKLQNVLGSHLIRRNVLLSIGVDSSNHSNAYTWTTAYATLMSIGQMTGNFAIYTNKYDDGEANYKLPVFNFTEIKTGYNFWTRGVWGHGGKNHYAWYIGNGGSPGNYYAYESTYGVRPLIYIR